MHVLFVHQNYPAQFHHVAPALAARGWQCTFATNNTKTPVHADVRKVIYHPVVAYRRGGGGRSEAITRPFLSEMAHAHGVYETLKAAPDVRPDLVVAHSGFGSSLYLPHLYDAPLINFFEYYFRPRGLGQHLGYRPDLPVHELSLLRMRGRNACFLLDLDNCDRGWCPNKCQRDTLPEEYHHKLEVIPEGIDADFWKPGLRGQGERILPDGTSVPAGTRIITYTARGLERIRGFDIFMRAAKLIYDRFPDVLFVAVGEDKSYYNEDKSLTGGKTFREFVLGQDEYDLSKFRFTGRVPGEHLARILGMSDLHIYLTEPFVTSWSLLDAMSCGCIVLASDQACVREYVRDGENGLLTDFFDVGRMADRAIDVLSDLPKHRPLGDAARRTIVEEGYALKDTLPRIEDFFRRVAAMGPRTPSMRAELIVRPGAVPASVRAAQTLAPAAALSPRAAGDPLTSGFDGIIPWRVGNSTVGGADPGRASLPATRNAAADRPRVVLFCWELGAGLGHLAQIKTLAADLVAAGHRVFVAARNLDVAEAVLAGTGVAYLAAPYLTGKPRDQRACPVMRSLAHILANVGWASEAELFALAGSWRNLFRLTKPDLLVFDHSPTAMLAARGLPTRRAVIGSGFCCPPDVEPWPALRPGTVEPAKLLADEQRLLRVANRVAARYAWPELKRLADLYAEADETFLITLPELDHFPDRPGAAYWGPVFGAPSNCGAGFPACPQKQAESLHHNGSKKILAYLARTAALPDVLEALRDSGHPTLAYVREVDPKLRKRFAGSTLSVTDRPLDLDRVVRESDLAILNAGHGTTAQVLLAGRPVLLLPLYEEQILTAEAVARLGAGERLPSEPVAAQARLREVLADDATLKRYTQGARAFAACYVAFDVGKQRRALLQCAERLLRHSSRQTPSPTLPRSTGGGGKGAAPGTRAGRRRRVRRAADRLTSIHKVGVL